MVATVTDLKLRGLPRRLVQEGILEEASLHSAAAEAKKDKASLVSYLVDKQLADPTDIALAASHEFGVPIIDLDALEPELEAVRLVDQRLLEKHRVLPLFRRGRKLFVGLSDPTNLQAIDEIKFQTSLQVEAVVVEDNKLRDVLSRAMEAVDTTFSALDALRQQGPAGRHKEGRLGHPLRALRAQLPGPHPHGRGAEGARPAAGRAVGEGRGPHQGHVPA